MAPLAPVAGALVLSLAFVYYYRLDNDAQRVGFAREMHHRAVEALRQAAVLKRRGFAQLELAGFFSRFVEGLSKEFCDGLQVEDDIAMNAALRENLFVTIICVVNRIPVFLVGKPGSSKTLTMKVLQDNLQVRPPPPPPTTFLVANQ